MSRIGKVPIQIPKGAQVTLAGTTIAVKGPKGDSALDTKGHVELVQEGESLLVRRHSDARQDRAYHGLYHRLIGNMFRGVTEGFEKRLELVGVGYRAQMQGQTLVLSVGYSHDINVEPRDGVTFATPAPTQIVVSGFDKSIVGQIAADIRAIRPPEPYKGKGIRYADEYVRRKVGKSGA